MKIRIIDICIIIFLLMLLINIISINERITALSRNLQFEELRELSVNEGIAFGDESYCIYTKGKSTKEIYNNVNHEVLHVLIAKNYKHFCETE